MIGFFDNRRSIEQLLVLAALVAVMYVCANTLRFTNEWLNVAFETVFCALPFVAIGPVRRLRGWMKPTAKLFVVPGLLYSSLKLVFVVGCGDVPVAMGKIELSREVCTISQGSYSVHLLQEETAGGAIGPHWLALEQRKLILPGLYVTKTLDSFENASGGSLAAVGADAVRLHIPRSGTQPEVDQIYRLKRNVYF